MKYLQITGNVEIYIFAINLQRQKPLKSFKSFLPNTTFSFLFMCFWGWVGEILIKVYQYLFYQSVIY